MSKSEMPYVSRTRVKAGHGAAARVLKDQVIAIRDLKGGQVVDFWAIDLHDFNHYASPSYSIVHLQSLKLKVGDTLYSNRHLPALTILADDVGVHDLLYPPCDQQRYAVSFGVKKHRNCHNNFLESVAEYGWGSRPVPFPPYNLFMNMKIDQEGRITAGETPSKPGDHILFRADMDLLCVASSCPMDLTAIGAKGITDIEILVADRFENLD